MFSILFWVKCIIKYFEILNESTMSYFDWFFTGAAPSLWPFALVYCLLDLPDTFL